ncbi:MAG: hypothetical protein COA43_08685 [Robiginitomaculum sp.]|nr:MAG: hypothetical protein COA43_08685 [Robiginitomaculum sp.]
MTPFHQILPQGTFKLGDGRASGWLSFLLALLSALTMLAIAFPTYLTTPEFKIVYANLPVRSMLAGALLLSCGFGLFSIMKQHRTRAAFYGLILAGICLVFGGANVTAGHAQASELYIGLDWFIFSLVMLAPVFIIMEKINPVHKGQAILRPEWKTDMSYFIILHFAIGAFLIITNTIIHDLVGWFRFPEISDMIQKISTLPQFLLLILFVDLTQYWLHRLYHENKRLWRVHAVHHSAPHMDWLAGSRLHIVEAILTRTAILLAMTAIGFSANVINIYVVFIVFSGTFIHTNFKFSLGVFENIFVTPKIHHWHHAKSPEAINKNYAIHLSLLDRIFGTYYNPKHWPDEYGVV